MVSVKNKIIALSQKINNAKSIILTTHKMCDGDGLGSVLSFYHALCNTKKVQAITVDDVSNKYDFLSHSKYTQNFSKLKTPIQPAELSLVFDTNDYNRIQPLYTELKKMSPEIIYIDHHPIPSEITLHPDSVIDTSASSTGELCYFILKQMGISITPDIATALYVSIVSDTQRFNFIKNSSNSHKICADLCRFIKNNEYIYNQLFGITSLKKMYFMAHVIQNTSYLYNNTVALLEVSLQELQKNNLQIGDACDFLDLNLGINSIEYSILIINLSNHKYKLSLRSKTKSILHIAEAFKGGGHHKAAGALLENYKENPKIKILKQLDILYKK